MLDFEEFLIKWIKRKLNSNGSKIDGKIGVAVLNFGRKESLEDFKDLLFVIVVKIEHAESVVVLEELGKFGCALCSCLTIRILRRCRCRALPVWKVRRKDSQIMVIGHW